MRSVRPEPTPESILRRFYWGDVVDYLEIKILVEVMAKDQDVQEKYSQALLLILENGYLPEDAFEESGFDRVFQRD